MPATPNIIDQLGTSWKLTVQEFAVYSYQHPTFGYLEYTGRTAWLCDNVNTVWLTSKGSLPDNVLPPSICIRPKYDGTCGCYDLNTYDPPEVKCLCKDPECPFELELWLTCSGVTQSAMTTFTATDGASSECTAAGPVYVGTATLNSVVMEVHIYCDGTGQWYADVFNDDVLCQGCIPLTPTFCPLVMSGGESTPCDNNCVPCIGPECEPPPLDCCDLTGVPSLTADNNAGATITLSDVGGGEYAGTGMMDVPVTLRYSCSGTTPSLLVTFEPGSGCSGDPPISYTGTIIGCDPMEVDFAGVDLCGTTRTITVTE